MALTFRTMDAIRDRNYFVQFRNNAARASFGEEDPFDEQEYADLIAARTREFPDGYVMVEQDGRIVGQIEMHPREFEGRTIAFISLFYLVPELRGQAINRLCGGCFSPPWHQRVSSARVPHERAGFAFLSEVWPRQDPRRTASARYVADGKAHLIDAALAASFRQPGGCVVQ